MVSRVSGRYTERELTTSRWNRPDLAHRLCNRSSQGEIWEGSLEEVSLGLSLEGGEGVLQGGEQGLRERYGKCGLCLRAGEQGLGKVVGRQARPMRGALWGCEPGAENLEPPPCPALPHPLPRPGRPLG